MHSDKERVVFSWRYLKQIKEKKEWRVNHRDGFGKTRKSAARAKITHSVGVKACEGEGW